MTDIHGGALCTIEPLDPLRHDRAAFSCGIEQVDNYFQKTANKLVRAGNLRVYVLVDPDGQLVGFYALNGHAVHYADLPRKFARDRPGHGTIPAAYISMIGVDRRFQGQGYGSTLLVDALRNCALAAKAIGIRVVLLDVLDCGSPEQVQRRLDLYAGYGFRPLPSAPLRLFLPLQDVEALVAEFDGEVAAAV